MESSAARLSCATMGGFEKPTTTVCRKTNTSENHEAAGNGLSQHHDNDSCFSETALISPLLAHLSTRWMQIAQQHLANWF